MVVITLAKTKELLGITGTDSDTAISAKIPYIDAKVKQITNNRYDFKFIGSPVAGSNKMYVDAYLSHDYNGGQYTGINNYGIKSDISQYLEIGQLITGTGIPTDTYISNIVNQGTTTTAAGFTDDYLYVEMSANATSSEDSIEVTGGISINYQDVIAKGIAFLIDSTNSTPPKAGVASESIGSYNFSLSEQAKGIDGKNGMPSWFVSGLPSFQRGL